MKLIQETSINNKEHKMNQDKARIKELEKENSGLLKENIQMYKDIESINNQVDELEVMMVNLKNKYNK